ncbi:MAG: type II secretion system protein GspJ [Candidatus Omnitrophota bacterium]
MSKFTGNKGLTFIELVLAVSIFSVVAVVLYSVLNTGILAWRSAEVSGGMYQELRYALDILSRDLRNAVVYSDKEDFVNFSGKSSEISFYSLQDTYDAASAHTELRKIAYNLDETKHILQRLSQSFADSVQKTSMSEPEEIAGKIDHINFYYCYEDKGNVPDYKWESTWNKQQALPRGVKIELGLVTKDAAVFNKYIFIPTGEKGVEK